MSILQVISLGNDIVDLYDPDTVHLIENKKFLDKVYTRAELENLSQFSREEQHKYLWKLWAAKEAAYKAVKRLKKDVVFSPRNFGFSPGINAVVYEDTICFMEFQETSQYLYAAAFVYSDHLKNLPGAGLGKSSRLMPENEELSSIYHDFVEDLKKKVYQWVDRYENIYKLINDHNIPLISSYSQESALCRTYAAFRIAQQLNVANVGVEKTSGSHGGIPEIYINNEKSNHLVSMTHHGRFCAVLFCPE